MSFGDVMPPGLTGYSVIRFPTTLETMSAEGHCLMFTFVAGTEVAGSLLGVSLASSDSEVLASAASGFAAGSASWSLV
jgi:hypothetical protein